MTAPPFECAETDYDRRGDCAGPYGVGETATWAYEHAPRTAVELCRSHGRKAVGAGQLVRWTAYSVQPEKDHAPAPAKSIDTRKSLQLVVTYSDDTTRYYPVTYAGGWKVDPVHRELVIGRGVPRTFVPLDNVRAYSIEHVRGNGSP